MANNPLIQNLPADLPTNWQNGQIVAPSGASVGLSTQHGYNYLMQQSNASQMAINAIAAAFSGVFGKNETIPVANGGTGATTATNARTNLSVYSKTEVDSLISTLSSSVSSLRSTKLNTIGKGVNLLNNWDFRNPLNSRGSSSYYSATSFVFAIDTWRASNGTTLSIVNGGITLSATSGAAWNNIYAFQRIKNGLQPGTYTLSALFDNNAGTVYLSRQNIGTGQVAVESSASSGIIKMTFTLTTALDENGSYFRFHVSNSARFLAIKLELGEESTLAEQKDGTWVLADAQPNYAENVLRCSMNGEASDTYGNFPFLHIASGSYVGTGTYGSSNPNSLSFSFAPKIIWCASSPQEQYSWEYVTCVQTDILSTSYQTYAGFGRNTQSNSNILTQGRKSADGKTFFWYNGYDGSSASYGAQYQLNTSGKTYHYTAIG